MFNDYKPRVRRTRSKKKQVSHIINVLRVSIWACLTLSLAMVFFCALSYISNSDIFHVGHVTIEGLSHVERDEIMSMLELEEGDNIFAWEMNRARTKIKEHPWVRDVRISRRFIPAAVKVAIDEYTPVASLLLEGKEYLLDANGQIFAPAEEKFEGLQIKVKDHVSPDGRDQLSQMVRKGMDAVKIVEDQKFNVLNLTIDSGGTMDIGLADGIHIVFLDEMSPHKAEMAVHTIRKVGLMGKKVMDLTCEDKIVLRNMTYGS